ncbi:MAG: hypothetical protein ACJ8F7_02895 [Gemmataceae bacterium]
MALCLYELHLAQRPVELPSAPVAEFAEQQRMFEHLRAGLEAIHFLYGPKADALMHAVRQLIGRAQPTAQEVKLLHGLARQLEWIAENASRPATSAMDDGPTTSCPINRP